MRLTIICCVLLSLAACKTTPQSGTFSPYEPKDSAKPGGASDSPNDSPRKSSSLSKSKPWRLWVDPDSPAAEAAAVLDPNKSDEARLLSQLAQQAVAYRYSEFYGVILDKLDRQLAGAKEQDAFALMLIDYLPYRDCRVAQVNAGAASTYKTWIDSIAQNIDSTKALIVLEPHGLSKLDCLPSNLKKERLELLHYALKEFRKNAHTLVFLDAGAAGSLSAEAVGQRLKEAGIAEADGFALNTAQYQRTDTTIKYGLALSKIVGKNFVIDTSHNGNGPPAATDSCNPRNAAIGELPSEKPTIPELEAYLWLRQPGESDGACGRGEPAPGSFFKARAVQMARAAAD